VFHFRLGWDFLLELPDHISPTDCTQELNPLSCPFIHAIHWLQPSTIFDNASAIALSRPCAACWYRIAAWGVECPSGAISSARVAPVCAASTAPV
jgi:hypothetical protein